MRLSLRPFDRIAIAASALTLVAAFSSAAGAQKANVTIDDFLNMTNASPADLSPDGRWLILTTSVKRDNFGTNSHRHGDLTYANPNAIRVWLVDTKTGAQRP